MIRRLEGADGKMMPDPYSPMKPLKEWLGAITTFFAAIGTAMALFAIMGLVVWKIAPVDIGITLFAEAMGLAVMLFVGSWKLWMMLPDEMFRK